MKQRVVEMSEVLEFRDGTDPELLRGLADWLEQRGGKVQMYALSLTCDYDGDGTRHVLHAVVDDWSPSA